MCYLKKIRELSVTILKYVKEVNVNLSKSI